MAWYTRPIKAIGSTLAENAAFRHGLMRTALTAGLGAAGGALYGMLDPGSSVFGGMYRGAILGGIAGGLGVEPGILTSNRFLNRLDARGTAALAALGNKMLTI